MVSDNRIGRFVHKIDNLIQEIERVESYAGITGICHPVIRKLNGMKEDVIVTVEGTSIRNLDRLESDLTNARSGISILNAQAEALARHNKDLKERNKDLERKIRELEATGLGVEAW